MKQKNPFSRSRRNFLQLSALAGASVYFGMPRFPTALAAGPEVDDSPLARLSGPFPSTDFNGDDSSRPHEILWRIEDYIASKGGRPKTFSSAGMVVVGGGMAGLLSAYFLRDRKPLVIEQDGRFGGNSKGESYQGSAYSMGAAYITVPDAGSPVANLLSELKLDTGFRYEDPKDTRVLYHGVKSLWDGETGAGPSARKVDAELRRIYEKGYPEIPWGKGDPISFDELKKWDSEDALTWLKRVDPDLHPHVQEYFQLYAWSSFGGSLDEISAAQCANFVAAETVGIRAFPGGNSAITAALHQRLRAELPPGSMNSHSIVLEVKEVEGGVEVLYEDRQGKLQRVRAPAAVVAAPKYVARVIVKGISKERDDLWRQLPYRAYTVSNVLLKQKVPSRAYDLFWLEGQSPEDPMFGSRTDRPWTDFIYGSWADQDQSPRSVLTLYKPYPFDGARSLLMGSFAHQRIVDEVEKVLPDMLEQLGVPESAYEGTRVTRWGHSLPLARTGFIADGTLDKIGAPQGRIFFANQDNFMNPAFETAFATAQRAADGVNAALR
jgi:hypothetical protein